MLTQLSPHTLWPRLQCPPSGQPLIKRELDKCLMFRGQGHFAPFSIPFFLCDIFCSTWRWFQWSSKAQGLRHHHVILLNFCTSNQSKKQFHFSLHLKYSSRFHSCRLWLGVVCSVHVQQRAVAQILYFAYLFSYVFEFFVMTSDQFDAIWKKGYPEILLFIQNVFNLFTVVLQYVILNNSHDFPAIILCH